MIMEELSKINGALCPCEKKHEFNSDIITGEGCICEITNIVKSYDAKKPYILSDVNTFRAAGETVSNLLDKSKISYSMFTYADKQLDPDEKAVGSAFMHLPMDSDMIIAVGSGVINDIAKILAVYTKLPYVIVATAPSMDGYASATSSMTMNGLKISLNSKCADVIVGDIDILCKAPIKMLISGLGDMLAKYVSICEWRISSIITGEYYCENIAELVRCSLTKCVDNAEGLLKRDKNAVKAVFEGLITCGAAMKFAGLSRPASGIEHYFSHIWDMRGVEFGTPVEFHGIQCALGTLLSLRLYEKLKDIIPDKDRALRYAEGFDLEAWNQTLRTLLGRSAEDMISLEKREQKYDKQKHRARLDIIIEKWDEILKIINEELPSSKAVEALMIGLDMPTDISELGIDKETLPDILRATKDIRDKYVLSRLLWDLGIIDEFADCYMVSPSTFIF